MIADFGLSRVMEEEKFQMLTEICGTPGVRRSSGYTFNALTMEQYMAPEIFKKSAPAPCPCPCVPLT